MSNLVNNLFVYYYSMLNLFYENSLSGRKVMSAKNNNASCVTTQHDSAVVDTLDTLALCCVVQERYRLRLLDRKSRSPRDGPLTAQILLVTVST